MKHFDAQFLATSTTSISFLNWIRDVAVEIDTPGRARLYKPILGLSTGPELTVHMVPLKSLHRAFSRQGTANKNHVFVGTTASETYVKATKKERKTILSNLDKAVLISHLFPQATRAQS